MDQRLVQEKKKTNEKSDVCWNIQKSPHSKLSLYFFSMCGIIVPRLELKLDF